MWLQFEPKLLFHTQDLTEHLRYITIAWDLLVTKEQHIHLFTQPTGTSTLWTEHLLPAEVLRNRNTKRRIAK